MQPYDKHPTDIQKRAINAVIAGESNIGKAMREAGYSPKSSENPKQNLMDRRGVQEYLNTLDDKAKKKFNMSALDKALDVYLNALEALLPHLAGSPDHKTRMMAADRLLGLYLAVKRGEEAKMTNNAMSYSEEDKKSFNDSFRAYLRHLQYNT